MIEIRELTRTFGDLTAVDRLTLSVPKGEIFGLVGPDGAGKTTTLRILATLILPTSGEAFIDSLDVTRQVDAVKDRIGYMAQRFGLYGDLTVEENMLFYADLFGITGAERAPLMDKLLDMTRMAPFRSRPAAKLSGGMKQKLALMCTLLHKPNLLFLDEPTNGVDPVSRRDFWVILKQLVQDGMTVFTTTAYLDEAERCDRVGLMHKGRLVKLDTPQNLRQSLGETCFEVKCADLRRAREILTSLADSADLAGSALHVITEASPDVLRGALENAGISGAEIRSIVPSLEDVFIATIRKEGARAA